MPIQVRPARDVRHLFGGKPSDTPYNPSTDGPGHDEAGVSPSVVRTPKAPPPEPLETIFARIWEQHGNGLKPVREYTYHETRHWRFDFCWPDCMVAVECDGITAKGKGGRHNSDGDREKMNRAAVEGFRVLHFSRMQLEDQAEWCAELVRKALEFGR